MPALTAGKTAPDFSLPTVDGKNFSLREAAERGPVVLAFFKVVCPVCQYAFPFIERIHRGYQGKKVTVVGVSQNSAEETLAFMKQYGVTFPVVLDDPAKYQVSNAYGLTNVPTAFYIAPGGEIEVSSVGWSRAELADINSRLAQAVKAAQAPVFKKGEQVEEWKAG